MINSQTLARPYAKAAFEFAQQAKQTDAWFSALELATRALEQSIVVQELAKPTLTRALKADFLINLLAGKIDASFANFLRILGEHDRLALIPAIFDLYHTYKAQAERVIDVQIETAYKLTDDQLEKITVALSKRLDRTINAKQIVNNALIGGLTIKAGDLVIDSSVRGRLNKLAEVMNS